MLEAVLDADAAVVVTEWPQLRETDWGAARDVMRTPLLFDGCNLLDRDALVAAGFTCMGIGRATARPV